MPPLHRILPDDEWRAAEREGVFRGSAHDLRDGFIHLSAPHQIDGTLAAHYAGVRGLVLLTIDAERLAATRIVKWEPSRGGELFPHLYGTLPANLVIGVAPLLLDASGKHVLPGR